MSQPVKRPRNVRQATPIGGIKRPATSWSNVAVLLWRAGVFTVLVTCAVGLYLYGGELWQFDVQQPVDSVKVEGEFVQLSESEASALISEAINRDFVKLDIKQLKQSLERHPWIERVVVSRGLGRTLTVTIIEQAPIALWGAVGFMNQRGEVIHTDKTHGLTALPVLDGDERISEKIMRQFQDLSQMVRSRNLNIRKLWVDELGGWTLSLDGGALLVLGKDELPEKVQRFLTVYDEYLVQHFEAVKRIDLRYANGLAVAWSDQYEVSVDVAG
ncbi:cell division protein FtsQ/DivIB [Gilvimarinus sp. SDUM040013]|uniref:Cell division protein FtsQ n=1 Tax=Gilvimarinus gilvus TaxID=3058038 RepID=A0ABU4RW61_9GAMM|nr:cell division protein FtsQ/DivIB [Gilvimarinus sp. SDUM040013]MDO3388388.1 cell division protein FtsQ/DivIB [Gilvimarinus sp. SDUM040013]MDX6847938.1 cell division protein FtsQ/DivIB [Gilvimarinus sp. SDUM040013]